MAKKGHKLFTLLAISAAAAGAYYYFQKKNSNIPVNMEDDEDLDNFDEDVDDGPVTKTSGKRSYVNLDFNAMGEKVQSVAGKVADTAGKAATTIGNFVSQAESKVEEFFDDRKAACNTESEEPSIDDYEEPSKDEESAE